MSKNLQAIESKIEEFYHVANALLQIKERNLYRGTHETFEAYCQDRWNLSPKYVQLIIDMAKERKNE